MLVFIHKFYNYYNLVFEMDLNLRFIGEVLNFVNLISLLITAGILVVFVKIL